MLNKELLIARVKKLIEEKKAIRQEIEELKEDWYNQTYDKLYEKLSKQPKTSEWWRKMSWPTGGSDIGIRKQKCVVCHEEIGPNQRYWSGGGHGLFNVGLEVFHSASVSVHLACVPQQEINIRSLD